MRRTTAKPQVEVSQLLRRIHNLFEAGCYEVLLKKFGTYVQAVSTDQAGLQLLEHVVRRYEEHLVRIPQSRFEFDSWIIQDIADSWSSGTVKLPKTIIPSYGTEWGHLRFPSVYDSVEGGAQVIFGIIFPGADSLRDANLLEYPWLCHELGHTVFDKAGGNFTNSFSAKLREYCLLQRKRGIADSHFAQERVLERIERLVAVWQPKVSQKDWAHELGVDLIALWHLGPAFLASYEDMLEKHAPDAFQTKSEHPPYLIRTKILISASEKLGWKNYCSKLSGTCRHWQLESESRSGHNELVDLGNVEIANALVEATFNSCREWKIPCCTPTMLADVSERRAKEIEIDTAYELILNAWSVYSSGRENYENWERATVAKFIN